MLRLFCSNLKNSPAVRKMTMKNIIIMILGMISLCSYAEEKVIFSEDFDQYKTPVSLEKLGWRVVSKPGHSTYIVQDGKLYVTITPHASQDGFAAIEVPICRTGQIDFDVLIDPDKRNAKGIGLSLDLYNISTFWHDYCSDWRLYFPEPTAKRMSEFSVEPVGHQSIGKVKKQKWIHYRIIFDTDNDRVEYYIDDMRDPAYVKGDAAVLGRSEYQGGELKIGSFGMCSAPYQAVIDNIIVRDTTNEESLQNVKKDQVLLFRGISFDYYNIGVALRESGFLASDIRNYDLDFWRSSYISENTFKYSKFPNMDTLNCAKCIVLIDAPCTPDDIIPEFLQRDILNNIRDGGKLIIFGGLFSLGKGGYQDTLLSKIMPVKVQGPWEVKGGNEPLPISSCSSEFQSMDWSMNPCVFYTHDLSITDDAKVLLKAGDKPLLVSRSYGKGEVFVFLGTVCGDDDGNSLIFWKWKNWNTLVDKIIN